jgi:hypothetical protein
MIARLAYKIRNQQNKEKQQSMDYNRGILEEDKFRDLRYLSRRSALTANEGHQFPASSPLLMK